MVLERFVVTLLAEVAAGLTGAPRSALERPRQRERKRRCHGKVGGTPAAATVNL